MNTEQQRTIVQGVLRDVLKDVIAFCDKHEIEYFMMFGSLLGAVRHGGMIPWDDDIDIAMTRDNCRRFMDCVMSDGTELLRNNDVKLNGSGSVDCLTEIKIGRKGTKYCAKIGADLKINTKITVDIFCVDNLKKSYVKNINKLNLFRRFLEMTKLNWEEKRYLLRLFMQGTSPIKYLKVIMLFMLHLLRMVITEKGIECIIYRMAVDTSKSSKYMGIVFGVTRPNFFSSGFTLDRVKFDGLNVFIPSNYDEILTRIYGDYMSPPSENERYGLDKYEIVLDVK